MKPLDTRIWNLFLVTPLAAGALAAAPGCGTRALDDGEDTDTSAESGSSGSGSSASASGSGTSGTDGECRTDADCDYGYCSGGVCYDWPCGLLASDNDEPQTLSREELRLRCQPYYECWDDVDCGDGYVCEDFWCAPDPNPEQPIGPACDDDAALPSRTIPVPELEVVLDLSYGDDTLAIAGTTLGTDVSRVVLHDVEGLANTVVDLPTGFDPQDVALGDLDGDGTDDLLVLDPNAGMLFVRDGAQQTVATFGVAGLTRIGVADLTADVGEELFGLHNGGVTVWTGSTPGSLGKAEPVTPSAVAFVDAADADGDGDQELLIVQSDGAAMVHDLEDMWLYSLEDSYPQETGLRRLASVGDAGQGSPLILDAEAWNDATFLRRHTPIPGGFGPIDADWPMPFEGTVKELALVHLVSSQTVAGAVALGGDMWIRLDITADQDCWRMLASSTNGDMEALSTGDADGNGVEGLAFTDGLTVWIGGD